MLKFCLGIATALLIVGLCSNVQSHSGDEVVAPYGGTPTVDGTISPGEWNDARTVNWLDINNYTCRAYVKQDGFNLYVAFDLPDPSFLPLEHCDDNSQVVLDLDHNGGAYPQTDDLLLIVFRFETVTHPLTYEYYGTGTEWS